MYIHPTPPTVGKAAQRPFANTLPSVGSHWRPASARPYHGTTASSSPSFRCSHRARHPHPHGYAVTPYCTTIHPPQTITQGAAHSLPSNLNISSSPSVSRVHTSTSHTIGRHNNRTLLFQEHLVVPLQQSQTLGIYSSCHRPPPAYIETQPATTKHPTSKRAVPTLQQRLTNCGQPSPALSQLPPHQPTRAQHKTQAVVFSKGEHQTGRVSTTRNVPLYHS